VQSQYCMALVLANQLETLAYDNLTERAREVASLGYSSVLLRLYDMWSLAKALPQ
jgi:hypothetical protein